jgi:hypothetical protein
LRRTAMEPRSNDSARAIASTQSRRDALACAGYRGSPDELATSWWIDAERWLTAHRINEIAVLCAQHLDQRMTDELRAHVCRRL